MVSGKSLGAKLMITLISLGPAAAGLVIALAYGAPIVTALMVRFLIRVVAVCKR